MKNLLNVRSLFCLLLAAAILLPVSALPARADEETRNVTFRLELNKNTLLARYSLAVYLDDTFVRTLQQGDQLRMTLSLTPGPHTLRFVPGKNSVDAYTAQLQVDQDLTVTASLQTHRKYIEMESFSVRPAGEEAERLSEGESAPAPTLPPELVWLLVMGLLG